MWAQKLSQLAMGDGVILEQNCGNMVFFALTDFRNSREFFSRVCELVLSGWMVRNTITKAMYLHLPLAVLNFLG